MTDELEKAQEEIAKKLGIGEEPTGQQAELLEKMNETLMKKVFYLTMEKLSEEDREIFLEKVEDESTSEKDITAFLQTVISDYDSFVQKTVEDFFVEMNEFIGESGDQKKEGNS